MGVGMKEGVADYCSFLVRLWLLVRGGEVRWVGEVERVQDGRRWRFESLEEVGTFFSSAERFLNDNEGGRGAS